MKLFLGMFLFLTTSMSPLPEELIYSHQCVPRAEISCVVDTSFICPPGYIDGCITNETRKHECIPLGDGPSCEIDMAINCPKNFEDGCLSGDTDIHLCIPKKGPLCTENLKFSCPSGFEDSCLK